MPETNLSELSNTPSPSTGSDAPVPSIHGGPFEARFATTPQELEQAQRLRYQVLFKDSNGNPDPEKAASGVDVDEWDANADHIIVCDNRENTASGGKVVGTLRIASNKKLAPQQLFYTEQAFDLSNLRKRYDHIVELGRFCISPSTRNGIVLGLIWKLASAYILQREVELMLGCASFPGADASLHTREFGFLLAHAIAPQELAMPPVVANQVSLQQLIDSTQCGSADAIGELRDMPPLVRGYLKMGARCSDSAIIDPVFNTTFVCIYVDAANFANTTTLLAPKKTAGNTSAKADGNQGAE